MMSISDAGETIRTDPEAERVRLHAERDAAVSALFDVVHAVGGRWEGDDGVRRDFGAIRDDALAAISICMMKERGQWADEAARATKELAAMTKERDHWASEEARLRKLLDTAMDTTLQQQEQVRQLEQVIVRLAARSVGVDRG